MKLHYLALAAVIFTALFASCMQCRGAGDKWKLRRNERKMRRAEKSRRLRTQNKEKFVVVDQERIFHPETVNITPAIPEDLKRPEETLLPAKNRIRLQQRLAQRSRLHLSNNEHKGATTPETEMLTTPTNMDNADFDTNITNIAWSGDHDLISINNILNGSRYTDALNSTFTDETNANKTIVNLTTTNAPETTTPDPKKVERWRNQQRNKMMRLMMIQTEILRRLGFNRHPNVSTQISAEARENYEHFFDRYFTQEDDTKDHIEEEYYAKRYFWHLPSCDPPRRSDSSWSEESDALRLYFDVKVNQPQETKVSSATLHLYKNSFTGCDCELISHDATATPPEGQGRRRRQVTHDTHVHNIEEQEDEDEETESEEDEDEDEQDSNDSIRVTLYQYQKPVKKKRKEKRIPLKTILVTKRQEGWLKFDLGPVVSSWLKAPSKNFGLVIVAEDMQHRILDANLLFDTYNCSSHANEQNRTSQHLLANQTYPYLEVIKKDLPVDNNNTPRFRRDISSRKARGCVRHDLYVSFADLGWSDWIVAPTGFEAGYCKGSCSSVVDDPSGQLRAEHFTSRLPGGLSFSHLGCCGPIKLKPLTILYLDDNDHVTLSVLKDFIIGDCGCRP